MADNRRNKNNSKYSANDEFDWEAYDRMTSQPPASRRRAQNSASASSHARTHQSAPSPAPSSAPRRRQPSANTKKRRKKQLTPEQMRFRKRLRLTLFAAACIIIVVVSGITIGMYAAVKQEISEMNIKNLALNSASFIYYTDVYGQTQELEQITSAESRIWVESDQISPYMKDAIVSIEDERFYKHHGVDIKRTTGATIKYVLAKVGIGRSNYGGSTITQQVIKNITKENENNATRKVKEMMRAVALEKELTKDEILTLYLNIVFFGNNCNGVESAANTYFNKNSADLNIQEAASIAGITQYPSEYEPIYHTENNKERRNTVLSKMYELGKINESEYQVAVTSEVELDTAYREGQTRVTSYFADQVVNDVISDLQTQKGYSYDFATQQVYNGGLKIYATIDKKVQDAIEDVFTDSDNYPYAGGKSQAAMVVMDPYTGRVKGIAGGLGKKTDIRGFNRATQAIRQPGSSIKPLSVYGPAIDKSKITQSTVLRDEEIEIGNDKWKPKNSYRGFLGDMTVKEAIARSANIPAVRVLEMLGLSNSYAYLQNHFHISTLEEGDKNYSSLALGGLTKGVTVRDMAGAYSVFANGGQYIVPHTYTQVVDANGLVMLENYEVPSQSISAAAAYITSDLLYGVVNSGIGTGGGAQLDSGMPTYGKTGTTDEDFDKWFVGFTPYYVGAVWYGFDNPSSISYYGVSGNPSVTLWNLVMEKIHSGLTIKRFEQPSNVVSASVCERSGLLATDTCDTVTAYFIEGTQPKNYCNSAHASMASPSPSPTATASATIGPTVSVTAPPEPNSVPSNSNTGNGNGSSSNNTTGSNSSSGNNSTGSESSGNTPPEVQQPDNSSGETGGGSDETGGSGDDSFEDLGTVTDN